jgi:demethylsterigmatocystin 6-O-methyltransferase
MDAIIAQAKSLAKTADEGARKQLLDALRDLSYSLETPQDTIQRVQYQVRNRCCPSPRANWLTP